MRVMKTIEDNNKFVSNYDSLPRKMDTSPYFDDVTNVYQPQMKRTWKEQFDPQVINPQMFSLLPSSVWSLCPPKPTQL